MSDTITSPSRDKSEKTYVELIPTGVTSVTDVQCNGDEGSPVTNTDTADETDVPCADKRPCFRVFDEWQEKDDEKFQPGVWYFEVKAGRGENPPVLTQTWVCSPLHVDAVTYDAQDNNYGRLLRFRNTSGRWRKWAMPMELLGGSGDDLRRELLFMGVEISQKEKGFRFAQYLQFKSPKRHMRCASQVGWCDGSFVLPDTVIGPKASGVIFQSGERGHDEYTKAGTLAGWQTEIAARAVGNPILALALSASFAGPMLARCNAESGGIHFMGDSSTGKTTAIEAACSIWSGENFKRSWRATANGMEGAAVLSNDCLLALDEISECDPQAVGSIIYALGNGRGKQRASRSGSARSAARWRCFVLSSGENTISTTMAEGGHRTKAGQSMRLLDVPAARRFGAWDELHDFPSGTAFSDVIKLAAKENHGHAGREFLQKLTRDKRDFSGQLERIKRLPGFSVKGNEGQEKRAAARFALAALAGELATEYGVTGWPKDTAINAAVEGFKAWRGARGGQGNNERRQILEQVSDFIERHGDSRFSGADDTPHAPIIRDRAGWWRDIDGKRHYLFTASGLHEATGKSGGDFKRALDVLQEAGALLPPKAGGERATPQRFGGRLERVYSIHAERLRERHGD